MRTNQLNHVGLHVADVARSRRFYEDVLCLEEIGRPAFDFPGAWYRLGMDQELHLIAGVQGEPQSLGGANHLALRVDDLEACQAHLEEHGVEYRRQTRPDGVGQIYVFDPDGHSVELCE